MDDDERDNSGLGGFAWYQLGRWSAEGDRDRADFIARLNGRAPVPVRDYNHAVQVAKEWRAECRRLEGVASSLEAQLNAARADCAQLKASADRCAAECDRWKAKYEHQSDQTWRMSGRANRFQDELERLKSNT